MTEIVNNYTTVGGPNEVTVPAGAVSLKAEGISFGAGGTSNYGGGGGAYVTATINNIASLGGSVNWTIQALTSGGDILVRRHDNTTIILAHGASGSSGALAAQCQGDDAHSGGNGCTTGEGGKGGGGAGGPIGAGGDASGSPGGDGGGSPAGNGGNGGNDGYDYGGGGGNASPSPTSPGIAWIRLTWTVVANVGNMLELF